MAVGDGGDGHTWRRDWCRSLASAAEPSVMMSLVALSVSAIVISGEGGSVGVAAVAIAIAEAAPIGWVDPRGHVERKKANSARRSAIWATNISIPTYGRCV